jgi:L-2-hydroxyglutarate oxidase LhgO
LICRIVSSVHDIHALPHSALRTGIPIMQTQTSLPTTPVDVAVVGGGIVGLAAARELLLRHRDLKLVIVDEEAEIASHQTGHNSGVIHTGIYYRPGSMKARACVAGHSLIMAYCDEHEIPYERCGKVIVALDESELPRLNDLFERGTVNGVEGLEMIGPERLREIEPYAAGIKAIYSPNTGIIDYGRVARAYAEDVVAMGGMIVPATKVLRLDQRAASTVLVTARGDLEARSVITCAGLYSDKISAAGKELRIVPFRGSYYCLRPDKRHMTRALIYPVPDPSFPFLGVHFTRVLNGDVWIGPNAVLAFAREGYQRWKINPGELLDTLTYAGFWKLAGRYWRMGLAEMYRDYVKSAYIKLAQRYMPELTIEDTVAGPSGVRAQALDFNGGLLDDFAIKQDGRVIHVQNAPSPAATSSLVIGQTIADAADRAFELA